MTHFSVQASKTFSGNNIMPFRVRTTHSNNYNDNKYTYYTSHVNNIIYVCCTLLARGVFPPLGNLSSSEQPQTRPYTESTHNDVAVASAPATLRRCHTKKDLSSSSSDASVHILTTHVNTYECAHADKSTVFRDEGAVVCAYSYTYTLWYFTRVVFMGHWTARYRKRSTHHYSIEWYILFGTLRITQYVLMYIGSITRARSRSAHGNHRTEKPHDINIIIYTFTYIRIYYILYIRAVHYYFVIKVCEYDVRKYYHRRAWEV